MGLDVSLIVPVYNEEESLPRLVKRVHEVMAATPYTWELICVNDGSRDGSEKVLRELAEKHKELKPLYFRRNYGQTAAMQAGFDHAEGEFLVTLDGDLQNDPGDIPRMLEIAQRDEADIVSGWRKNRKDKAFRSFLSRVANRLISRMTHVSLHDYGCSLKVYRRDVVENMHIYGELHRFIPAVVSQFGAKVVEVEVTHHAREFGVSKYGNMGRMVRVVLDLLLVMFFLRYINRPMHAFGTTGLMCLIPGGAIAAYLTALKLVMGSDIGGRPLLMLAVLLILMGVQLIGMGILGELLVRIYHEPHGRQQYILKKPQA